MMCLKPANFANGSWLYEVVNSTDISYIDAM